MNKRTGKMTMAMTPQELQTLMIALKTASEQLRKQAVRAAKRDKDITAPMLDGMAEDVDKLNRKVLAQMLREGADIVTEIIL